MNKIPQIIKGPAIIQLGDLFLESTEDITLSVNDESTDISVLSRGTVASIITSRRIEINFTPIKASDFAALYRLNTLARGAAVFGLANKVCKIWGEDGVSATMPRAEITAQSVIGAGISKALYNSFTITCLHDPTKPQDALSSLIEFKNEAMPALPDLQEIDIARTPFVGILTNRNNPADKLYFDLKEGAEITCDVPLSEEPCDRLGLFDFTVGEKSFSVSFEPVGLSIEQWQKLASLSTSTRLGGVLASNYDLQICGMYAGDPVYTLKGVVAPERGLTWSSEAGRFPSLTLNAMGVMGQDKFSVGKALADFIPPADGEGDGE